MIQVSEEKDLYLSAFARREKDAAAGPSAWLAPVRRAAIERFADMGFPTTRQEAWKYTNVSPIIRSSFHLPDRLEARRLSGAHLAAIDALIFGAIFGKWGACRMVFVDGLHVPALSRYDGLPEGVTVSSLDEAIGSRRALIEPHLARHADSIRQAFVALNTAFLGDGGFIHLPARAAVDKPIHLVFVSTKGALSQPRNLILMEEESQASVVESYIGMGGDSYLANAVTEIVAGESATLDHYKLQREAREAFHVATTQIQLGRDSSVVSQSIALGGLLVRNDVNAVLDAEGADCTLNGLYALDGGQHLDNHTLVDHAKPHGVSRQLYKGVLDGRSRGVFDGTVIVRKDAQKTDSRQENRNLILSEEALVDTKPTLQIHADDVKCSHAATIGQLEEQSMFYLRSRAIDADTARRIMIHAFVSDVVRRIKIEPIRAGLDALLFSMPDAAAPAQAPR